MRSISSASLLLLMLVVGCEHKSKKDQPPADKPTGGGGATGAGGAGGTGGTGGAGGTGQASGAAKPTDDMPPEPVAKDPGTAEVRPPVAADLEEYTKDLKGTGTKLKAEIETSLGTFHCELHGDKTPITVANFVGLATGKKPWRNPKTGNVEKGKPYFDGLIFHRVIPGFMIQGGDPLGQGTGGPGYDFVDEFVPELRMAPGTLAMANAGPRTNGSQFFITEGSPSGLNDRHTIFGKCAEVDLVKKIENVEKLCPSCPEGEPDRDRPKTDVVIKKVTITKG